MNSAIHATVRVSGDQVRELLSKIFGITGWQTQASRHCTISWHDFCRPLRCGVTWIFRCAYARFGSVAERPIMRSLDAGRSYSITCGRTRQRSTQERPRTASVIFTATLHVESFSFHASLLVLWITFGADAMLFIRVMTASRVNPLSLPIVWISSIMSNDTFPMRYVCSRHRRVIESHFSGVVQMM